MVGEEDEGEDKRGVGEEAAVVDDRAFDSKLAVCSRVLTMSNLKPRKYFSVSYKTNESIFALTDKVSERIARRLAHQRARFLRLHSFPFQDPRTVEGRRRSKKMKRLALSLLLDEMDVHLLAVFGKRNLS